MKLELLSPGMENAGKAGKIGSQEMIVFGKGLQGFGRGMKEGFIACFLMSTDKVTQFLRHGEGDQEVGTRDLPIKLFFEPLPGFVMLALGAVAVSTGSEDVMDLAAVVAFIDGHAVKLGAALDHGLDGFLVVGGHVVSIAFDILGAVSAEDFVIVCMLQLLHQVVDFLPGILLPLIGQMEVNHGSLQSDMAEELLNAAQVDSGLQQMGGI